VSLFRSDEDIGALDRRALLGGASLIAAALGGVSPASAAQVGRRRTFVLIHGAWHGGWVWKRVVDRLEARGHYVLAPTLTGLADRSHLLSASVDLDTHINDVANLFEWNDLNDVVLVAHSYGGWPVSGALERIGSRVGSLVLLDAFVPENGDKGTDVQTSESAAALQEAMSRGEFGRPVPSVRFFHIRDPADAAWVKSKLTPQPIGVSMQPIRLTGARDRVAKKAYIRASDSPSRRFDQYYANAQETSGWRTFKIDSGHDVMVDAPDQLTELLLSLA
jgi:pimeloyl-ACP methyl ester carboxylesterase